MTIATLRGQALWFVAPGWVEWRPLALAPPEDGQVLVRTTFSGISSGTELLAYRGQLDPDLPLDETLGALAGTFSYPFRYGYSCVGVVEGDGSAIAPGTRVFAFQPHQDVFVADADAVVALGAVGDRVATLLPLVETALQVTLDAGPVLGEPVVVYGLGTVGALTCLLLMRAGARVLGVEPRPWRRTVMDRLGITAVAPDDVASTLGRDDWPDVVPLVIEASGNPSVLPTAMPLLAHEGTLLVASWYGRKEVTLALGAEFHRRRLTLRSTQVSTIPARLGGRWTVDRRRRAAVELMGELPLETLATHTFDHADAAAAYAALDDGREGVVHVALGYG